MKKCLLFPVWQIDRQEFDNICFYLDVTPRSDLYQKLSDYLANAPFINPLPKGFSLFLAKPRLTQFRIARLDLLSKFLFRDHPIRFILNAVIALYECDGEGYAEISEAPEGARVLLALLKWGLGFCVSLILTLLWLCWQGCFYFISLSFLNKEDLSGKRVLITGANRGLGLDILRYCLQQGAEVIGTVRNRETYDKLLTQLPEQAAVKLIIADLSQTNAITTALQDGGIKPDDVDIAVLCAGIKHAETSVLSVDSLRETFEINCFSSIDFSKWLCSSGHKSTLVLISSIGRWHGMHSSGGYNASKAALSIWAESLEMELYAVGNRNHNIMTVEPGVFESGMMQKTASSQFLFVSRIKLAEKIMSGVLSGKKVLRYPVWFAFLTWTICLGGRNFQNYFFARASQTIRKQGE